MIISPSALDLQNQAADSILGRPPAGTVCHPNLDSSHKANNRSLAVSCRCRPWRINCGPGKMAPPKGHAEYCLILWQVGHWTT